MARKLVEDGGERNLLLESSGLTVLAPLEGVGVPSPQDVWRRVAGFLVEPDAKVPTARSDWHELVDSGWLEFARARGVIGVDGTFLVHVGAAGLGRLGWARVRWNDGVRLAEILTDGPRCPEFVTMACDGRAACGVTTEDDDIWLVGLDQPGREL